MYRHNLYTSEELYDLWEGGMSLAQVGDVYGVSRQAIWFKLKTAGYELTRERPRVGWDNEECWDREKFIKVLETNTCAVNVEKHLGISPAPLHSWLKYHKIDITDFGYTRAGKFAPCWKGGRWVDPDGYVHINCYDSGYDKWNPDWKHPSVHEHKSVFEQRILACIMLPGYLIHHVDENRENNDIDNLVMLSNSEHGWVHKTEKPVDVRLLKYLSDANSMKTRIAHTLRDPTNFRWEFEGDEVMNQLGEDINYSYGMEL